jgi:hypothetical protein
MIAAALLFTLLSTPNEMDGIGAPTTTPFVAPGQLFQINIPYGWTPYSVDKDPNAIQFKATLRGGDATLIVRKFVVPAEARPRGLVLNAIDQRLSRLPRWQALQKRDVALAGQPAASVIGTYAYQGNLQYPRLVEQIFVIIGTEAYSLFFECFEPQAQQYAGELNGMYASFQPRVASPTVQGPFAVPDDPSGNNGEAFKLPDPKDIPF